MSEPTAQELLTLAANLSPEELAALVDELTPAAAATLLEVLGTGGSSEKVADSPLEQAGRLMEEFAARPHLVYLSDRIAKAVKDVEGGTDRKLIIEMPPRTGKSTLATQISAAWALSRNPSWQVVLTSYSGPLATSWGRQVRRWTSEGKLGSYLKIAPDAGAATDWDTINGGKFISRSLGGGITGFGAKLLIIDDPHKDFADAHSAASRDAVWDWWLSTSSARLNPPSLVIVIMTRWHEDDLVGRLLSREYPGDPDDWEVIRFPAIAEEDDVIGRSPGDPLYSPLVEETREEALERWGRVKESVGEYVWNALFQQRPSAPEGSIFDVGWWKYWTTDPDLVEEGNVVLLDPEQDLAGATWLDSWDLTFKGNDNGDWTVGQRWAKLGANRFLVSQQRGRWGFTQQVARLKQWAARNNPQTSPAGQYVHIRLIEDAANAAAAIDTLKDEIAGLKPIRSRTSKEVRARAITPEIESGNVYLPHPATPGFGWVNDLISELREFPNGAHDDQVDAMSQALFYLRDAGVGGITMPGESNRMTGLAQPGGFFGGFEGSRGYGQVGGDRVTAARTMGPR